MFSILAFPSSNKTAAGAAAARDRAIECMIVFVSGFRSFVVYLSVLFTG